MARAGAPSVMTFGLCVMLMWRVTCWGSGLPYQLPGELTLALAMEPSGWTMCCVLATRALCWTARTPGSVCTTVATKKMPEWCAQVRIRGVVVCSNKSTR